MNQLLPTALETLCPPADRYAPIRGDLEEVERVLARTLQSDRPCVVDLVAHLSHFRGKRLRPALLLLTARACGRVTPAHHVLGAVVEMVHTATLVHDDVLDNATVRRHVATVNARWDNQTSILLGDYLFSKAYHLASTLDDVRACRLIGEATNRVCEGELRQVWERGNLDLTEADYLDIIDGKTAELTACCCRLGALFAGAETATVESLARFGRRLGMAFQIADDLLDLVGEEQRVGKSLGTDVELQKLTLPLIRVFASAAPEKQSRLRQLLAAPGNHKREALWDYFAACDALSYARQRAEEFGNQARTELACLSPSLAHSVLDSLCSRVVDRKS